MISRNDPCFCGSGKKWKKCHYPDEGPTKDLAATYLKKYRIRLKTPEQIAGIKRACKITANILKKLCDAAKEGVTTDELNTLALKLHKEANVIPAPLNYGEPPFPKAICTSLNDVICHGIPDDRPLQNGDIMNIDVSCIADGYYGDCSAMVTIGEISKEQKRVVDTAKTCLTEAISICKPGVKICEIGDVIEQIAKEKKCSVVNQFVAHGVGLEFHEEPQIPHHRNTIQIRMAPGMTFTIEPMINSGSREGMIDDDEWTARTVDGGQSAQWEHTILITENGHEILTVPD